ncbi:hypothetical protein KY329_05185 [Candidatus Woesearchaeota archaeon]|nr:hypothetical protein [Candidatus Woesearchaeota archaeon]
MRGQGLPITIIIIAALGILVLIVIGAIFGVQITKLGRAASECPGICVVDEWGGIAPAHRGLYRMDDTGKCTEFETELTGAYIPKGTPKDVNLADYACNACCVPTG